MNLLMEAVTALSALLLSVAAGLLLEELSYGALVRLLLAPRPQTGKRGVLGDRSSSPGPKEPNHKTGDDKCSH